MKVTVNKLGSHNNLRIVKIQLAKILEDVSRDFLVELTKSSVRKLEKTIYGTLPRGSRESFNQKGFENARVGIIESKINSTPKGASIKLVVRVVSGTSSDPHYIWHLINGGRRGYTAPKTLRFPVRKQNRTRVGNLNTLDFSGYTGDWRAIKRGERVAPIEARNWYETALEELDNEIIKEYSSVLRFVRKEANN